MAYNYQLLNNILQHDQGVATSLGLRVAYCIEFQSNACKLMSVDHKRTNLQSDKLLNKHKE